MSCPVYDADSTLMHIEKAEVRSLRAIAEQAIRYHEDCGHEQYEDRRQCDPICTAAIAWRASQAPGHATSKGDE